MSWVSGEDGVGDDGDSDEHVPVARDDTIRRYLRTWSSSQRNPNARDIANDVARDGPAKITKRSVSAPWCERDDARLLTGDRDTVGPFPWAVAAAGRRDAATETSELRVEHEVERSVARGVEDGVGDGYRMTSAFWSSCEKRESAAEHQAGRRKNAPPAWTTAYPRADDASTCRTSCSPTNPPTRIKASPPSSPPISPLPPST